MNSLRNTPHASLSKNSWRDQLLKEFTPEVSQLTLVADPDGLFLEEGVLAGIREQGFDVIPFEDAISFRYLYESKYRLRWDAGEQADLVVVLHAEAEHLSFLPYDLLQAGRRLSFSLCEIFPNLSYPVVAVLDCKDLDVLYESQMRHAPGVLGDNATKEFILRHVFEVAPELIKKASDLLRVLLRRHYRDQRIPAVLDELFIQLLCRQNGFQDWPLEAIIPDREAFFRFLQERWPLFLNRSAKQAGAGIQAKTDSCLFEFSGPDDLPFGHDDIRVYIDNLFIEGFLETIPHDQAESLSKTWMAVGIRTDKHADGMRRINGLLETLSSDISKKDMRHDDWFRFAGTWAELGVLTIEFNAKLSESTQCKLEALQCRINTEFMLWLTKRFSGLINLPPVPPVMLHHIPRFLSRYIGDSPANKTAFVLVDGLALDQWIVMRKELAQRDAGYRFRENAIFAWIPTLTSVSRQAAFAGRPPIFFPNSIHTTNKEPALWIQFWMDHGLTEQEITYKKGLGDEDLESVEEMITRPGVRVVGLVIDKVDRIMHGMTLGAAGMHNQIRQWMGQPFMANLIDLLLGNGFRVHLSSDHGNISAAGCGRPEEGAIADLRGERTRIYPNPLLRSLVKNRFPDTIEWPPIGLPEKYFPLLAPDRSAFVRQTERIVGHGGASLEEAIVPLVQIERKE